MIHLNDWRFKIDMNDDIINISLYEVDGRPEHNLMVSVNVSQCECQKRKKEYTEDHLQMALASIVRTALKLKYNNK